MTNEKDTHIVKIHGRNAQTSIPIKMFSTNGAGVVNGKIDSLKMKLKQLEPQ